MTTYKIPSAMVSGPETEYRADAVRSPHDQMWYPRVMKIERGGPEWPANEMDVTPYQVANERYGVEAGAEHTACVEAEVMARREGWRKHDGA